MSPYPTPEREGHWWAKLRLHDNPDLRSVDWEVVQVFENMSGDPCEADVERGYLKWMASVPGIEGGQPLDAFVWGPPVHRPEELRRIAQ